MSSSRTHQEISCSSSLLFFIMQQALENKLRNKKMAAARAGLSYVMFAFFLPYKQYALSFFPLRMGHLMQRSITAPASHLILFTVHLLKPFSGIISRGFGCFPVGERKEKENFRNIKVAVVIEKGSCKLTEDEENIHIHSHTKSRYRCLISPAHFDHFYTQMDTLGRC